MLEAFRRACLELPEETKRELRRLEQFHSSPEWKAYWSAAKASMDGDDAPIRAWAEERIGHKADSVLRVRLRGPAPALSEDSPAETWEVVRVRGARLRSKAKARDSRKRVPNVRAGAKQYPDLLAALRVLASGDQTPEQALIERLFTGTYESAPHVPDKVLASAIANQIRWEAFERPGAHKTAGELVELAEFASREISLKRARDAGLPPREYELYRFFVDNPGSTNAQAAQTLGIAVGTVKNLKHRIKNTAV